MSTTSAAAGRYDGQAQLDAAAAALWTAIRAGHPELPELAPGLNARYPAEPVPSTAELVAISVLREAVHELAAVRGVSVVSRGGRYHNRTFSEIAAELGLVAEGDSKAPRGWATLSLAPETAARLRPELQQVDEVLAAYPPPVAAEEPAKQSRDGRRVAAVCHCSPPYRVWLGSSTLDAQVVMCARCAREGRPPLFVDSKTLDV
ncbi:hypothetical protein [Amycolatopsis sp. NPDC059657]|uniref:hypothetical protein n=1 Tax=Amycolatopsis sp. NPDC059657 TaxID=3346899 RepID=UPI0036709CD7